MSTSDPAFHGKLPFMPMEKSIINATLREPYGEDAYIIVDRLMDAGFDTWWVGGAIRDMLQGKVPKDIDIATAAHPDQILRLFPRATTANAKLGSVRVRMHRRVYEITTFRTESPEISKRMPLEVSFGTREEDAERRDFTINALYFNPSTRALYDPFHGEEDLKERLIRFIGDPVQRITQDPLRLLRAIRMRATLEAQYHPDTFAALHALSSIIRTVSKTRQLEELEKLLLCGNGARGLEDMWELDILEHAMPVLHRCKGTPQPADFHHEGDVWDHTLQCVRAFQPDHLPDVRLATLFHDIGKVETFTLKERIRFDHHATLSADLADALFEAMGMALKRREKIHWLIEHHMTMTPLLEMNEERKTHWYHHPWFMELLQVFWLDIAGTTPADYTLYDRILADYQSFLDSHPLPLKPLLTGNDIQKLTGLKPGSRVGELLEMLREEQEKGTIRSKKEAIAYIESHAI